MSTAITTRARTSLQTAFVADAMAAPAHWYYDPVTLAAAFPNGVSKDKFEAVPPKHPFTFMKAPQADPALGGKKLVGDIILRRTGVNWGPVNAHPHCSLKPGENTTNANVARLLLRGVAGKPYSPETFVDSYITFMTDPEQALNNDTYVEGYHRTFFTNLTKGAAKDKCGDDTEGAASAGAFTTQAGLILSELIKDRNVARVKAIARKHLHLTAPVERAAVVLDAYVELIDALLFRETAPGSKEDSEFVLAALTKAAAVQKVDLAELLKAKHDTDVMGEKFPISCDLANSWPSALYLAAKYQASPIDALLANTNISGENCHRGFILGSIVGLISSNLDANIGNLENQLVAKDAIRSEIDAALTKEQ